MRGDMTMTDTITGTADSDTIHADVTNISESYDGVTSAGNSFTADGQIIDAGNGDDYIWADVVVSLTLTSSAVVDWALDASTGDMIFGGEGSDQIYGDFSINTDISSGSTLTINVSNGSDSIFGGAGDDWIAADSILVTDGAGSFGTGTWIGGENHVEGGAGNDTIYGGIRDDELLGDDGDDGIFGDDGNDIIDGGDGADVLYAGEGNDRVYWDAGDIYIDGEEGFDRLINLDLDQFIIFDLVAHGFERVVQIVDLTPTSAGPDEVVRTIDVYDTVYDWRHHGVNFQDGSRTWTTFDPTIEVSERTVSYDTGDVRTMIFDQWHNGLEITRTFDSALLATRSIEDGSDDFVWFTREKTYDGEGDVAELVATRDNGVTRTYGYDEDGLVDSLVILDATDVHGWASRTVTWLHGSFVSSVTAPDA